MTVGIRHATHERSPGALLAWWNATHLGRAATRFGQARGSVLAAGIAYYGFFSILPALAIGFTVFSKVLGSHVDLQDRVVCFVNDTFGFTVISTGAGSRCPSTSQGLVSVEQLILSPESAGVAGFVSILILLWTGLGWLFALRQGIRAVFGQNPMQNFVLGKLRDLAILCTLGVLVLASVAANVLVTTATHAVLGWLGWAGTAAPVFLQVASNLLLLLVDTILFLLFFRALAGVAVPLRDLLGGSVMGAVGLVALTVAGSLLLRKANNNQFLAVFGTVIVLLLWVNLAARISLLAASWSSVTALNRGHLEPEVSPDAAAVEPRAGKEPDGGEGNVGARPRAPRYVVEPNYGVRQSDKVTLAAGAVLGASAMLTGRFVARAARVVRDAIR